MRICLAGMGNKHSYCEDFTITEYSREQKRIHHIMIEEQQKQGKLLHLGPFSPEETECGNSDSEDDSNSDLDFDEYLFLQPVPVRQRRMMLRTSGIKKIDGTEKDLCRDIRQSREVCGCDCRVYCDPETCRCSLAGIKCQVDRLSFPCGCSKDGCGNVTGRIEFNPIRVRTHFIHTLMRLELDKKDTDMISNTPPRPQQELVTPPSREIVTNAQTTDVNGEQTNVDLTEFNSNEKGSCRDCQNSEVCHAMMQEVQYSSIESDQCAISNIFSASNHYKTSPDSTTPLSLCPTSNGGDHLPRVMLFSDSDDDAYHAENTVSMFHFKQDDHSYSEASECSSEGGDYHKSYQNLTPFHSGLSHRNDVNSEFCIATSQHMLVPEAQSQESSYIELGSRTSGEYKEQRSFMAGSSDLWNCGNNAMSTPATNTAAYSKYPSNGNTSLCCQQSTVMTYPLNKSSCARQSTTTTYQRTCDSSLMPILKNTSTPVESATTLTQLKPSSNHQSPSSLNKNGGSAISTQYTVMTDTTKDAIAENCPAISTHMNSLTSDVSMGFPSQTDGVSQSKIITDSDNLLLSNSFTRYDLDSSSACSETLSIDQSDTHSQTFDNGLDIDIIRSTIQDENTDKASSSSCNILASLSLTLPSQEMSLYSTDTESSQVMMNHHERNTNGTIISDDNMGANFREIIKESIVEIVSV